MQGQYDHGDAYYRCRFPPEYALANHLPHPRAEITALVTALGISPPCSATPTQPTSKVYRQLGLRLNYQPERKRCALKWISTRTVGKLLPVELQPVQVEIDRMQCDTRRRSADRTPVSAPF
ncbi:hypothetical protein [Salinispora vitiensis]|uniref:hypothetical protein n=1 Tax=Salinispora vitiensis TaxID=999544 RepID=UPI000372FFF2